jgi:hypothetical protein
LDDALFLCSVSAPYPRSFSPQHPRTSSGSAFGGSTSPTGPLPDRHLPGIHLPGRHLLRRHLIGDCLGLLYSPSAPVRLFGSCPVRLLSGPARRAWPVRRSPGTRPTARTWRPKPRTPTQRGSVNRAHGLITRALTRWDRWEASTRWRPVARPGTYLSSELGHARRGDPGPTRLGRLSDSATATSTRRLSYTASARRLLSAAFRTNMLAASHAPLGAATGRSFAASNFHSFIQSGTHCLTRVRSPGAPYIRSRPLSELSQPLHPRIA